MKYLNRILIITLFIIVFIFLNRLVTPKYTESLEEGSMTNAYYKETTNHDVIFIGDCEVYANISPLVMYENYGITSYVRGNSSQDIWQSYYLLKETLKYEIPKVVVLNITSMKNSKPDSEPYNRLMLDYMRWSKEKVAMINASMTEEENILAYLFPILRYHSRITELKKEDIIYLFQNKITTHNGFLINEKVKPAGSLPAKRVLASYDFADSNYDYLDKIVKLCKENNIKLILMKAPSLYPYWYDEYNTQIINYARTNNLDYYNFIDLVNEIGIDFQTDTYDGGLHLNLNGATKLSKYFGNILKEKYNLTDYRNDDIINNVYKKKLKAYYEAIERK